MEIMTARIHLNKQNITFVVFTTSESFFFRLQLKSCNIMPVLLKAEPMDVCFKVYAKSKYSLRLIRLYFLFNIPTYLKEMRLDVYISFP